MPVSVSLPPGRGPTPQTDDLPWTAPFRAPLQGRRPRRGPRVLQRLDRSPQSRRIRRLPDGPPSAHQRLLPADARRPPDALLVVSSDGTRSLVRRVHPNGPRACLEAGSP
jgi:hypothetical protein